MEDNALQEESEYRRRIQAYESENQSLNNEIKRLNGIIEDLQSKLAHSRPVSKNHFEGWTLVHGRNGVIQAFKTIHGKTISVYIGKKFDPDKAREKLAATLARVKVGTVVSLTPIKRGRKPKSYKEE